MKKKLTHIGYELFWLSVSQTNTITRKTLAQKTDLNILGLQGFTSSGKVHDGGVILLGIGTNNKIFY